MKLPGARLVLALFCAAGPVHADTIVLKNGRTIEGKIVARGEHRIRVQIEGGTIDFPADQVRGTDEAPTPEDEYGERLLATILDDPDAVMALADWAHSRGLKDRARDLTQLALGVRLEQKFATAREAGTARAYLELAEWARREGLSLEVRRLALDHAQWLAPGQALVRRALAEQEAAEMIAAVQDRELAQLPAAPSPDSCPDPRSDAEDRGATKVPRDEPKETVIVTPSRHAHPRRRQRTVRPRPLPTRGK